MSMVEFKMVEFKTDLDAQVRARDQFRSIVQKTKARVGYGPFSIWPCSRKVERVARRLYKMWDFQGHDVDHVCEWLVFKVLEEARDDETRRQQANQEVRFLLFAADHYPFPDECPHGGGIEAVASDTAAAIQGDWWANEEQWYAPVTEYAIMRGLARENEL